MVLKVFVSIKLENNKRRYIRNLNEKLEVQSKEKILQSVSHDQRTFLNAIDTFAREIFFLLEKNQFGLQKIQNLTLQIIKMNTFQQYLLNDYLDYNRIKNKTFKILKKPFEICRAVQEVLDLQSINSEQTYTKLQLINNLRSNEIINDVNRL
jgi:signal transduction histidine kinase